MDLFGGKVKLKALSITDKPNERKEVQARLLSPGGEFAVLGDGKTAIRHLAYVELCPGKPRGNHFHKARNESFYVISGELNLHLEDLETSESANVPMRPGDLATISPGIVHTFVPNTAGHAIEFAPEEFDREDVYRKVII